MRPHWHPHGCSLSCHQRLAVGSTPWTPHSDRPRLCSKAGCARRLLRHHSRRCQSLGGGERRSSPVRLSSSIPAMTPSGETDPDEYITNYPYLLPETAQYMVGKGVRYIAMESISPDTTTTESHQILLGNGRRRGRERVQPGGHRGRSLLYHRHLPQLPGCHRRLDPDLGTLSVKLCSTNAEGPPHLGRPFSLRKKSPWRTFPSAGIPILFPPRTGRKSPRLALLTAPCGARAAGLGFPFEADFRPSNSPARSQNIFSEKKAFSKLSRRAAPDGAALRLI